MSSRLRAGRGHILQIGKRLGTTASVLTAGVAMGGLLCACSGGAASSGGGAPASTAASPSNVLTVSAAACGTGWAHPAAGTQTLYIRNTSRGVIEVQLIDPESGAVYAQLEGVGAGTTRSMPVDVGFRPVLVQLLGNQLRRTDRPRHPDPGPGSRRRRDPAADAGTAQHGDRPGPCLRGQWPDYPGPADRCADRRYPGRQPYVCPDDVADRSPDVGAPWQRLRDVRRL